jgi:hypothetical protein
MPLIYQPSSRQSEGRSFAPPLRMTWGEPLRMTWGEPPVDVRGEVGRHAVAEAPTAPEASAARAAARRAIGTRNGEHET